MKDLSKKEDFEPNEFQKAFTGTEPSKFDGKTKDKKEEEVKAKK